MNRKVTKSANIDAVISILAAAFMCLNGWSCGVQAWSETSFVAFVRTSTPACSLYFQVFVRRDGSFDVIQLNNNDETLEAAQLAKYIADTIYNFGGFKWYYI